MSERDSVTNQCSAILIQSLEIGKNNLGTKSNDYNLGWMDCFTHILNAMVNAKLLFNKEQS